MVKKIFCKPANLSQLSLLVINFPARSGKLPASSGLNWGHRKKKPKSPRNPNEAYLPLRGEQRTNGFFPDPRIRFEICTDDGENLFCVRAQENAKAIETQDDNSILGLYFRRRMHLNSGVLVTLEDMKKYGRVNVNIYKIDDLHFFMDFSI